MSHHSVQSIDVDAEVRIRRRARNNFGGHRVAGADGSGRDVDWPDTLDQRIAQPLMIVFVMVMCHVLGYGVLEVLLAERNAIQTLRLIDRTKRSAWAFAFGARHGVCTTRIPLSRSRQRTPRSLRVPITNRYACPRSSPSSAIVSVRRPAA